MTERDDRTERQDDSLSAAGSGPPAPAHLRVVFGRPLGAAFPVESRGIVVGRERHEGEAHAVLDDRRASRRHAKVARIGGAWQITDLGSRNGGFVEGRKLAPEATLPLLDGSLLRIGDSLLVFRSEAAIEERFGPGEFPGVSPDAARTRARIAQLRESDGHVLVLGDTGTGKERVARAIVPHGAPLVAVNCAELTSELGRAELFGHARGAFSGAAAARDGLVDQARGGVLFLDEIGELHPDVQADLLRFLEDGTYRPVGSTELRTSNARVVGATNVILEDAVRDGRFRRDLLARMRASNAPLELPTLHERREDVLSWADAFFREVTGRDDARLDLQAGAAECLLLYPWPENLRELRGLVRELSRAGEPIAYTDLPPRVRDHRVRVRDVGGASNGAAAASAAPREPTRDEVERALSAAGGRMRAAAEALGIDRRKLYRLCEKYTVDVNVIRSERT